MSRRRLDWDGFRVFTPERTWSIAWLLVRRAIRSFSDVRLWGRERIPKSGPVILASNHRSFYDIFVLGASVKRPIHYMAKVELFEHPVLGRVLPHTGAFPVRRARSTAARSRPHARCWSAAGCSGSSSTARATTRAPSARCGPGPR